MKRRDFIKVAAVAAVLPPAAASVPATTTVTGPWVICVPPCGIAPSTCEVFMFGPLMPVVMGDLRDGIGVKNQEAIYETT